MKIENGKDTQVEKAGVLAQAFWTIIVIAVLASLGIFVQPTAALPPEAAGYDPSGLVRFSTPEEAEAKRQELIHFIWADGLPTHVQPKATVGIDSAIFTGDLAGLDGSLTASVDRLDADVAPYDFHSTMYLVYPLASVNNNRLVIFNSGHRGSGAFSYGVNDAANRLLKEGFVILITDMPMFGYNNDLTVVLPNDAGTVTIEKQSAGHMELFAKLSPPVLRDGEVFRFFLEPFVQGINYFLHVTPKAADVSFVGLSGGGWSGHVIAALDVRIRQSFPVAGSYPMYCKHKPFPPFSHDMEQDYEPLYGEKDTNGDGITDTAVGVASWLEIYALGGYGPGRLQIQILNLYDTCCFFGDAFETYDAFVAGVVKKLGEGEWKCYSDTSHKSHVISPEALNQVILPALGVEEAPVKVKNTVKNGCKE